MNILLPTAILSLGIGFFAKVAIDFALFRSTPICNFLVKTVSRIEKIFKSLSRSMRNLTTYKVIRKVVKEKIYVKMLVNLDDLYYGDEEDYYRDGDTIVDDDTAVCEPVCDLSQALCDLTGREHFTRVDVETLQELGYKIRIKEFAASDYHGIPAF